MCLLRPKPSASSIGTCEDDRLDVKGSKIERVEKVLTVISVALCIMLGGHHLIYAFTVTSGNTRLHWMGAVEVLLIGGGTGIIAIFKSSCFKK